MSSTSSSLWRHCFFKLLPSALLCITILFPLWAFFFCSFQNHCRYSATTAAGSITTIFVVVVGTTAVDAVIDVLYFIKTLGCHGRRTFTQSYPPPSSFTSFFIRIKPVKLSLGDVLNPTVFCVDWSFGYRGSGWSCVFYGADCPATMLLNKLIFFLSKHHNN